jgi:hypothetical protein
MENYIIELEEHLKKYTNNNRHLKYYYVNLTRNLFYS